MKTILQNAKFFILFVVVLLFSTALGLCQSTNNLNNREEPFIEVGNALIQTPDIYRGPRRYFKENSSVMYTIEKNDAQWDLIFSYGGRLGYDQSHLHNNFLNYWLVDVYKNNEFIEKLHIKSRRYPPIAESKGRYIKIKIIPMHGNWYKLILYAQRNSLT